ncbi:MAG TPA: polymer-forming cytoskeletal protein [Thermoanaerobaculia bacterium]|jgi:cytoskeletal protein CcmA (bactofilin family)|nr:polymer-forming cytoskeletal protein [Thermoanaerobaculia bacterium]
MVWKKSEDQPGHSDPSPAPARPAAAAPAAPEPRRGDRATIGPSIFIKGDLTGDEDLVIEGKVEGKVDLKQNNVTVGKSGRVKADIFGRMVTVEGEVDGNVFAQEAAVLRQSGGLRGNISSPRVTLEDGSRFKGSIDMEPKDSGRHNSAPQPEKDKREEAPAPAAAGKAPAV